MSAPVELVPLSWTTGRCCGSGERMPWGPTRCLQPVSPGSHFCSLPHNSGAGGQRPDQSPAPATTTAQQGLTTAQRLAYWRRVKAQMAKGGTP